MLTGSEIHPVTGKQEGSKNNILHEISRYGNICPALALLIRQIPLLGKRLVVCQLNPMKLIRFYLVVLIYILLAPSLSAQTFSSDEYFQMARKEAFSNHNYPGAIRLSNVKLQKSQAYIDIIVYLVRVECGNNPPESCIFILKRTLEKEHGNEDGSIAMSDIRQKVEYFTIAIRKIATGQEKCPASK